MSSRKDFLKQLATGLLFTSVSQLAPLAAQMPNSEEVDWDEIRKMFRMNDGQIYLNSGTLGLMPDPVVAELERQVNLRVRKGNYILSPDAGLVAAEFLRVTPEEICITHNTTESLNIIANGLALRPRDEVIISDQEHVGHALAWLNRSRREGLRIKVFSPAPTAEETLSRIEKLISRRTRVIATPHITCTTGHLLPVKEISALAHRHGAWALVDGAHGPGTINLDLEDIGCDFYASCGHKWLCGPAGTGLLYIKKEQLDNVDVLFAGAYTDTGWELSPEKQLLEGIREHANRFAYGTQSAFLHGALAKAIRFMDAIGMPAVEERLAFLHQHLRQQLEEIPQVKILTPKEARSHGAILSFEIPGLNAKDMYADFVRDHLRVRMVLESKLQAIRISPHIFTTTQDLDLVVKSVLRQIGG